jgi:hypothetical protein
MNESIETPIHREEYYYVLDVKIPDQLIKTYEVVDQLIAGLDPRNDLILVDPKIKTKHFLFEVKNQTLTVHHMGLDNETSLNGSTLEKDKHYILEKGDRLVVGKIEINVRVVKGHFRSSSSSIPKHKPAIEQVKIPLKPPVLESIDLPFLENTPLAHLPISKKSYFTSYKLIPYKMYGFIIDVSLTYFLLSFVIPTLEILELTQDLLYPISQFIIEHNLMTSKGLNLENYLSVIEFFISFHLLMISGSLILGTTPGAFFIGLHHKKSDKSILSLRFRAYLYALINCVLLPLIIFDIPLFKGKNAKEWLTFSSREIGQSLFFKISRRAIMPPLCVACLFSPFFLKTPFNIPFSRENNPAPQFVETHTTLIKSLSPELGLKINAELSNQFFIFPNFQKKKISLVLFDSKKNKSLILSEQSRISYQRLQFSLRYANPLFDLIGNQNVYANEQFKKVVFEDLTLSLTKIVPTIKEKGPFFANGFLLKESFLKTIKSKENILINPFSKNSAIIKLSSNDDQLLFIFGKKELIVLSIVSVLKNRTTPELNNFANQLMSNLHFAHVPEQSTFSTPSLLEVLDANEHSNDVNGPNILTYYINEAKKVQDLKNPELSQFLRDNLEQNLIVFKKDKTKFGMTNDIEKSLINLSKTIL